tara:strand:- start:593 stop:910 length:318 start_codon:yes stop_codon:yes gene_type:complete
MANMTSCQTAMWILKPRIISANEHQLNTRDGHFIIDRTFVEDNIRWIIDYKITTDINNNLETYKAQLNNYANLFHQMHPNTEVKLMLYYPLLKHEITWNISLTKE